MSSKSGHTDRQEVRRWNSKILNRNVWRVMVSKLRKFQKANFIHKRDIFDESCTKQPCHRNPDTQTDRKLAFEFQNIKKERMAGDG